MCIAPFRKIFALIVLDGDADLPQHLLVIWLTAAPNAPTVAGGVEVEDRHKVLVLGSSVPAPNRSGTSGVGNTDGGRRFELDFDVEIIVLLQE